MNHIFHSRVVAGHYLALLLFTVLTVCGFLERSGLLALVGMLMLVLLIERLIHTTYTVTVQGTLVIDRGRFSKQRVISLDSITSIESADVLRIGGFSLLHYVLITYDGGKCDSLLPLKEEEFIALLEKRRQK